MKNLFEELNDALTAQKVVWRRSYRWQVTWVSFPREKMHRFCS